MKVAKRVMLGSTAAVIVATVVTGSVFWLKQARLANDELLEARRAVAHQAGISKRLAAELKVARTSAELRSVGQSLAELEHQVSDPATDERRGTPPAEEAESASDETKAANTAAAIEDVETLVANATQAGKWTEHDRDRLQEVLEDVDGPERRRIESTVGNLLVEGRLVIDGDFVPL